MTNINFGSVMIDVDQEITEADKITLKNVFQELREMYLDISDGALAQAIFFNWVPGMSAEAVAASTATQLGHHA